LKLQRILSQNVPVFTDEDDDVDGSTQGSAKDVQISTDSSKQNFSKR